MNVRSKTAGAWVCALGMLACSKDRAPKPEGNGASAAGTAVEGDPAKAPAAGPASIVVATPIPTYTAPPDVSTPPPDATKSASGLVYKVLKAGTGQIHPGPDDRVRVFYVGWMKDGRMFDADVPPRGPMSFKLTGVIRGWKEALQQMVVGEKRRLWVPSSLASGNSPHAAVPAGDLVYDLELAEIPGQGRASPTNYMP